MPKICFRSKKHAKQFAEYLRLSKGHTCSVHKHPNRKHASNGVHHVVIRAKGTVSVKKSRRNNASFLRV